MSDQSTDAMRHVCHECRNRHNVDPIHHLPCLTDWCSICSHRAEGTTLAVAKGKFGNWHVSKEPPSPPAERQTPKRFASVGELMEHIDQLPDTTGETPLEAKRKSLLQTPDVKRMGAVTICRNGYIQDLVRQLAAARQQLENTIAERDQLKRDYDEARDGHWQTLELLKNVSEQRDRFSESLDRIRHNGMTMTKKAIVAIATHGIGGAE